jgi:hypothetical protein
MAILRTLLLIFSQQGIDIQLLRQQANETFSQALPERYAMVIEDCSRPILIRKGGFFNSNTRAAIVKHLGLLILIAVVRSERVVLGTLTLPEDWPAVLLTCLLFTGK